MTTTTETIQVNKSKYGFHSCDRETFLKLKRLHKEYYIALRQKSIWDRWDRKAPQNRVIRKWTRNEKRQKIGYTIVGPSPEPEINSIFNEKINKKSHWGKNGQYHREQIEETYVNMKDRYDIVANFQRAKRPQASPKFVEKLSITKEEIETVYNMLKK